MKDMASMPDQIGPLRRSTDRPTAAAVEKRRAQFDAIADISYRYGVDLNTLPVSELIELLNREYQALKNADAFTAMQFQLRSEDEMDPSQSAKIDIGSKTIYVGVYKLKQPSMKQLNSLLGESGADAFFADVHSELKEKFGDKTKVLSTFFKGGQILIDHLEKGQNLEDVVDELNLFNTHASEMLYDHVSRRIQKLRDRITRNDFHNDEEKQKIQENIDRLQEMKDGLKVEIEFGFDKVSNVDMREQYMSLVRAEWAANISYRRKENTEKSDMRADYQVFDYGFLFTDLMRAVDDVQSKVLTQLGAGVMVDIEYQDYFELREDEYLYVTEEGFKKYRDALSAGVEYADMPVGMQAVHDMYSAMNVTDAIKPFTTDTFDHYLDEVSERVALLKHLDMFLLEAKEGQSIDRERAVELLAQADEKLKLSVKDRGEKISGTVRTYLEALLPAIVKVAIFGDHKGFAYKNYEDNQRIIYELLKLVDAWYIGDSHESRRVINQNIESMDVHQKERFDNLLSDFANVGTGLLRNFEDELYGTLTEDPNVQAVTFDSSKGDEIRAIVHVDSAEAHERIVAMLEAYKEKIRYSVLVSENTLPRITDLEEVSHDVRQRIVDVMDLFAAGEDNLEREKITEKPVEMTDEDLETYYNTYIADEDFDS